MQLNHPLRPVALLAIVLYLPQSLLLQVQPIPAHRLRRSSPLNVKSTFTRIVLFLVCAGSQLMYTPLLDDVSGAVEELHHIDVMVKLVNVTLPRHIVAFHE